MGRGFEQLPAFYRTCCPKCKEEIRERSHLTGDDGREDVSHVPSLLCLLRHRKALERKRRRHHAIVDTTTAQDAASYGTSSIPVACIKYGRF
jgi:hypothetical protein